MKILQIECLENFVRFYGIWNGKLCQGDILHCPIAEEWNVSLLLYFGIIRIKYILTVKVENIF